VENVTRVASASYAAVAEVVEIEGSGKIEADVKLDAGTAGSGAWVSGGLTERAAEVDVAGSGMLSAATGGDDWRSRSASVGL
jgi:hypothetical protein